MLIQRRGSILDPEVSSGVAMQLACSSLIAGGAGLLLFCWLSSLNLSRLLVVLLALSGSGIAGLLTTANIQYGLFLLHLTLRSLAEGKQYKIQQTQRSWPLHNLFRLLAQVNLKMDPIYQRERLTDEYQQQLLQQASEAAAAEERNHLAQDLHDSIKQQIFSIRMSAIAAKAQIHNGAARAQEALEDILQSSEEAQVEMQALLQQLRPAPLEHTSLTEAIQTQAQALEYRSGAQVAVTIADLPALDRYTLSMQELLFRIVQEAFANIARHARARHVFYTQIQDEKTLQVTICDDGQGFDMQTARRGMGLTGIQERVQNLNGTAQIESEPGKGTRLHIQIPLLLPSEAKELQEQREYTARKMIELAQGGLHLRSIISAFTLVVLVASMVLSAVASPVATNNFFVIVPGLCLCLMLYGLVSAHLAMVRFRHYHGEEDRSSHGLSLQVHLGWLRLLRLCFFISWQFLLWGLFLRQIFPQWESKLILALVAVLLCASLWLEGRQVRRAQDRYYPLLPRIILNWEMRLRWRDLRLRTILCLCLGLLVLLHNPLSLLPPITLWQWLRSYLLLSFLVLGVGIIVDVQQLNPWRKLAKVVF